MDFFRVGIDRYNRVFRIAVADRAWEIFFDRDELIEVDAARFVDDSEPADPEDFFEYATPAAPCQRATPCC